MEHRLQQIYDVGSDLFINKGYARTQIKDIAGGIGISVGTMYHYFTGKADILSFILQATIDPAFMEREFELPVDGKLFAELDGDIRKAFELGSGRFAGAYRGKDEAYEFAQMLSDAFDTIWQYGKIFLLVEKNPEHVGALAGYYRIYRETFYQQMIAYLKHYQDSGACRVLEYPEYSAQLIIETLAWWGMHIRNDAYIPRKEITKETAKAVCMDALLHAYAIPT